MIPKLHHYEKLVGRNTISHIREIAEPLDGKHVVHINATSSGGGVAEILNTLVFLMNDVGIDTGWRTIIGSHSFFKVTKGFHNSLQGNKKWNVSQERKSTYLEYCKRNSMINHINEHDFVIVHDPQPLAMIAGYPKRKTWLWRCHVDISTPNRKTMSFLMPYIRNYDGVIVSTNKFTLKNFKKPQCVISPSIDPLSQKNKKLPRETVKRLFSTHGIDMDKPLITQVSRFDPWKDHMGVIKMYQEMRKKEDCQLVLIGDMASDDPQGPIIYHQIQQKAEEIPGVTVLAEKNDLLVNALQDESAFVFQNSVKEGFALTVSEALWKGTPAIGTRKGGIPLQIRDGENGFLINNREEGVKRGLEILRNEKLRNRLGKSGHEHVKKNFLITRHLKDYLELFRRYEKFSRFA